MRFKDIIGQEEAKSKLLRAYKEGRVAHTQLFLGPEGSGALPLAIAFGQYVNCTNKQDDDSCGECPSCKKFEKFSHPDLYFIFPSNKPEGFKEDPSSELYSKQWIEYLQQVNGYAVQNDWYSFLNIGNKQGNIYARDANNLIKVLGFKPYEADYKIAIIWKAEKMDAAPSNKLLKTFEEPPDDTLIFLIAERYELLLPTVRSRAQLVKVPKLTDDDIREFLMREADNGQLNQWDIEAVVANAGGNLSRAKQLLTQPDDDHANFEKFREWLLLCYKFDYPAIFSFVQNLAGMGRERQKSFLQYGLNVVHQSLQINSNNGQLVTGGKDEKVFLNNFAKFINQANRDDFYKELNQAIYHIERNAHPAILFGDLSLTLAILLNRGKKAISGQ
jgi:DNA polymerase-3 subunit delta'